MKLFDYVNNKISYKNLSALGNLFIVFVLFLNFFVEKNLINSEFLTVLIITIHYNIMRKLETLRGKTEPVIHLKINDEPKKTLKIKDDE